MKKTAKVMGLLLGAAILLSTSVSALAAITVPAKKTVYMPNKKAASSYVSISVSGMTKSTKITDVKSSNKKVFVPESLRIEDNSSKTTYFNGMKDTSYNYRYAYLGFQAKKAGTAKVSFKAGKKTYTSTITVKKYVNPIKTLKISGYSSKNLASGFKSQNYYETKLKKNAKKGTVTVEAAKGWKISSVNWNSSDTNETYSFSNWSDSSKVTSATLVVPAMKKGKAYYVSMNMENIADGGSLYVSYRFGA